MSGPVQTFWLQSLSNDTAALPSTGMTYVGMHLGWSVVLAWLCAGLLACCGPAWQLHKRRLGVVTLLAGMTAWLPGPWGSAYWLGLVCQAPSTVTVLVCAGLLWRRLKAVPGSPWLALVDDPWGGRWRLALAATGTLLGWALLLDSFALLPVELYAWGFSPLATGLLVLLALLPWVFASNSRPVLHVQLLAFLGVVSLLVFVIWRLPTGNVWDAVLDPLLWLALQVYLVRLGLKRRATAPR